MNIVLYILILVRHEACILISPTATMSAVQTELDKAITALLSVVLNWSPRVCRMYKYINSCPTNPNIGLMQDPPLVFMYKGCRRFQGSNLPSCEDCLSERIEEKCSVSTFTTNWAIRDNPKSATPKVWFIISEGKVRKNQRGGNWLLFLNCSYATAMRTKLSIQKAWYSQERDCLATKNHMLRWTGVWSLLCVTICPCWYASQLLKP